MFKNAIKKVNQFSFRQQSFLVTNYSLYSLLFLILIRVIKY